MSLHTIAHHMASKGRGDDSMLVHMTPGEVAGLQALALKHGGSLTINPETGLAEAGFLKKLLPALIGFGLNMFAPGLGSAVGAALGTSAAVGTGIAVGGFEALRTGSLSKGLSAGLGAYGGAGLAGSMASAGAVGAGAGVGAGIPSDIAFNLTDAGVSTANADIANQAIQGIQPSAFDKVGAGFNAVTKDASTLGQFAKDNYKYGLAAASPLIADAMVPTTTQMPTRQNTGYIRPFSFDQNTQALTQLPPFKAKNGGLLALAEGGNPADDPNARYNQLTGQSKAAYDYLMGRGAYPSTPAGAVAQEPVFTSVPKPVGTASTNVGGTEITSAPTAPPPQLYVPPVNFTPPVETDPYDQENQDAINKIEQEVADEQYNQENQDAINKYEEEIAGEQYDQENQDAIYKLDQEVRDENFYNENLNDDELGYLRNNNPYAPPQNEAIPINPTPEELINRDEFGDLQGAIERNMEPVQNDGTDEVIQNQILAQEDPYGKLDDAIAANNLDDSARVFREVSDIDAATIGADNNTYSGFDPTSANPTIPVETLTPSPANDDELGYLTSRPEIDVAPDNGAAEAEPVGPPIKQEELSNEFNQYLPPGSNTDLDAQDAVKKVEQEVADEQYKQEFDQDTINAFERQQKQEAEQAREPEPVQPEPVITRSLTPEPEPVREPEPVGDPTFYEPYEPYIPEPYEPYIPEPEPVMPSPDEDFPSSEDYYNDFGDYGGFGSYNESDEDFYDYAGNAKGGLMAAHRYAMGGMSHLGSYSDGGRLLRGPGDGVSDSIPASIGKNRQPARLADGEFVVPARIVSELGNGSTEAGARKLYAMMDRIQKARGKTVGKGKVATNSRAAKHLPA